MSSPPLRGIDKDSPVPLYHQVAAVLEGAIREGRYPTGSLIEGEHELAAALRVSRLTLRKAVDGLVAKGLLSRERGVGTRILQPKVTRSLVARLTGLQEDLVEDGVMPTTRVLRFETAPCPKTSAEHFAVEAGSPMLLLERLRSVDGRPIALMRNLFPPDLFTSTAEELTDRSLYEVMRERGAEPRIANQTIAADLPAAKDAELLEMATTSPILVLERVAFDAAGTCIEHSRTRYAADRYSFDMRLIAS